ncbi:MAG: hypothetical protein KVP17_001488 [Porospora cf. gigantea B]|uniref:uncharacterized protein n=1 Tax=Porospora cf. gigantea B TaxID=2853592 RepID=UPI003571E122|nr:MAG: hypothetical protein KVP17_001488 [Porospora cf. gigantea B]
MLKEHEQQLIEGLAETRRLADSLEAGQVDVPRVTRAIKDVEVQLQHLALHLTESSPESLRVYKSRLNDIRGKVKEAALTPAYRSENESGNESENAVESLDVPVLVAVAAETIGLGVTNDLSRQRDTLEGSLAKADELREEVSRMTDLAKNVVFYARRNALVSVVVLLAVFCTAVYSTVIFFLG